MGDVLQWVHAVSRRAVVGARAWFSRTSVRVGFGMVGVLLAAALIAHHPAMAADAVAGSGPGVLGTVAMWIGGLFMWMASGIGGVIGTIIEVIVAITQYNHFSTSPVVAAGWAIVRDSVNMFYVVVLIAIAFGTIIGMDRFQWKQQVPKLLRWAIIINFSKTLCGLAIDASQVVTLTFANALKDIAGGNFISFLGLTSIMSISSKADSIAALKDATTAKAATGLGPADFMISGVLALVMMLIVLAVLLALVGILAFRIVMLWILITISPLAWFVGSIKGIVNTNAYSEWWSNFKCYLVIGPVLTFFLWLALAVAGAGNIAALEGFNVSDTNSSGAINAIFDLPRITSFILGLSLIMAGFKVANDFCHAAQGGSVVSGLLGKAQAFTASPFSGKNTLVSGGAAIGRGVGSRIPLVGEKAGGARRVQGALARTPFIGGALAGALGGRAKAQEEFQKKAAEEKAEKVASFGKSVGDNDKQEALLKEAQDKTFGMQPGKQKQALALAKKMVEDKDYRAEMERRGVNTEEVIRAQGKGIDDAFGKDEKFKKEYDSFKKSRADIFAKREGSGADAKYDFDNIKSVDDLKKFDFESMKGWDKNKRDQFEAKLSGMGDTKEYDAAGKQLSALEMLKSGKLGKGLGEKAGAPPIPLKDLMANNFKGGEFETADQEKQFKAAIKENLRNINEVPAADLKVMNAASLSVAASMSEGKGKGGGPDPVAALFSDVRRGSAAGASSDAVAKQGSAKEALMRAATALNTVAAAQPENKKAKEKLVSMHRMMSASGVDTTSLPPIEDILAYGARAPREGGRGPRGGGGSGGGTPPAGGAPPAPPAAPAAPTVASAPAAAPAEAAPAAVPAAPAPVNPDAELNRLAAEETTRVGEVAAAEEQYRSSTTNRDRRAASQLRREAQARLTETRDAANRLSNQS